MPNTHEKLTVERVVRQYYPDGGLHEEVHYLEMKEHGLWRRWYPNGVLAEEHHFENGTYHGIGTTWHPNGLLSSKTIWMHGELIEACGYDQEGKLYFRQSFQPTESLLGAPRQMVFTPKKQLVDTINERMGSASAAGLMSDEEIAFIRKLLLGNMADAREWLGQLSKVPDRTLGAMQTDAAIAWVEKMYELGAARVVVVNIEAVPGTEDQTACDVLVELPEHAEERKQLFAFEREVAQIKGFEGEPDHGQPFLYFKFE